MVTRVILKRMRTAALSTSRSKSAELGMLGFHTTATSDIAGSKSTSS